MTPSSAATTRTTIPVTSAHARMRVKASAGRVDENYGAVVDLNFVSADAE
jgi:hypothetical protein